MSEAAHYLRIPRSTLRAWVAGHANGRAGLFRAIIALPDDRLGLLSFINLVEAHVLDGLRTQHQISLQKVRRALRYLERQLDTSHPLAQQRFETDGVNLFVRRYGQLVNVSESGQLAMRRMLETYLRRVERYKAGESVDELAGDYGRDRLEIEEALRCELDVIAA